MPLQAPQWTDYLNCPICLKKYGEGVLPVNLGCGHSGCKHCVLHLSTRECPFDQVPFKLTPSTMVLNTAIMQLVGLPIPNVPYRPPYIHKLTYGTKLLYDRVVKKFEEFARYLPRPGYTSKLSKPMQKKIVQLIHCTLLDSEARKKVLRAIRNLADRTINEILLFHQNPQQLGPNLWAAVRARGCQFLGPAMQEEVLQLVLLALEDGSQLSRKVLVMFVVQKLEPRFPHVSKTSIGHVVQLLYRASCFTVSKRDSLSSLMQLKEEYRTYDSLRREHDAQIVQIAQEAGLRIAPDQWSSLLYGDSSYKSHMQSIMDRLYSPQAFHQATKELVILYKRLGWVARSEKISESLKTLCSLDELIEKENLPSYEHMADAANSFSELLYDLVYHDEIRKALQDSSATAQDPGDQTFNTRVYKNSMCYYIRSGKLCFRGNSCHYAHSAEELERIRNRKKNNVPAPKHTSNSGPTVPSTNQPSPSTSTNCEPGPSASTCEPGASDCTCEPGQTNSTTEPGPTNSAPYSSLGVITVHSGSDDSDECKSVDTMSTATVGPPNSPICSPTARAVPPNFTNSSSTARAVPPNFTNNSCTVRPVPPNFTNSSSRADPCSSRGVFSVAFDSDASGDEPDTIDATISNIRNSMFILRRPETARELMAVHFAAEQVERGMDQRYHTSSATPAPVPPPHEPPSAPSLYQVANPFNTLIVRLPLPYRREDLYTSAGFPRFAHPSPPPPYSRYEAPPPYQNNQAAPPPMMPTTIRMPQEVNNFRSQEVSAEGNFPERQPYTPHCFNQPDPERECVEPAPSFPPPRPFQPSSQRDNFIRSFSILTCESDHVPFDQGPSTSYGPISRAPTLTEPGRCNAVSDASPQIGHPD